MRNYIFLLLLLVGLMACSTGPPSTEIPDVVSSEAVSADNQNLFLAIFLDALLTGESQLDAGHIVAKETSKATPFYQMPEVSGRYGDLVISVDEMNNENRLYASLSVGYQEESESTTGSHPSDDIFSIILGFSLDNWMPLILSIIAVFRIVVRLTPSTKDNDIFAWIEKLFTAIPNLKKGGGTHVPLDN